MKLVWGDNIPTYEFFCKKCDSVFEVVESIKEYDGDGECPTCRNISTERILSAKIHFIGAAVESPEYNPAFGKVVKNKHERKELAKRHGLEEIGNEKPENIHKKHHADRIEKLKKSWDEV